MKWNMYTCCTSDVYARHYAHLYVIKRENMDGSILTINLAVSVSVSANDPNRTDKYGDLNMAPLMQTANIPISLIGDMDKKGILPCAPKIR